MIIAHEPGPGLRKGDQVKANVVWWRSGKLQRVVNSALAAETHKACQEAWETCCG